MKIQVYLGIAIRLVILFGTGMLMTLATPYMRNFFGDTVCQDVYRYGYDKNWNWGAVHYWYFWLMIFLFILSLINYIVSVVKLIRKHYDTSNWL